MTNPKYTSCGANKTRKLEIINEWLTKFQNTPMGYKLDSIALAPLESMTHSELNLILKLICVSHSVGCFDTREWYAKYKADQKRYASETALKVVRS